MAAEIPTDMVLDAIEGVLLIPSEADTATPPVGDHIREMFEHLERTSAADTTRLAQVEWLALPLFHLDSPPLTLTRAIVRSPRMFVDLVSLAYRAKDEPTREPPDDENALADRAGQLLHTMHRIPGLQADGTVDGAVLQEWVRETRALLVEAKRSEVGDYQIGRLLSSTPPDPAGFWPHAGVCDVIDGARSTELDDGFLAGVLNGSGVITKGAGDGGNRERGLAAWYTERANGVTSRWPRMAAVLRRIAVTYEEYARHEDLSVEIRQDIGF